MAEQSKNEMNSSIKMLEDTNEELALDIKRLEEDIEMKIRKDEE